MADNTYHLRYLPLFYDDLYNAAIYIRDTLGSPKAANDLIDETEKAILQRLPFCESFEPYHSKKERKQLYYRIYVKNYIVYYVVITDKNNNKTMEIRRFLSIRQNRNNI